MTDQTHLVQDGDSCWLVVLGETISPSTSARVHAFRRAVEEIHPAWLIETVPGYCTLGLVIHPLQVSCKEVESLVSECAQSITAELPGPVRTLTIPVCYGGPDGPDMETVCRHAGLSEQEVVRRHAGVDYQCAMLGFLPGFPYLTGLDEQLATPRLATPRTSVPAGSVGIAGEQTGIYPVASPGGWNIIGRTPLTLFDPSRRQPSLVQPGDLVHFVPISRRELEGQHAHASAGHPQTYSVSGHEDGGCEVLEPGVMTTVQDGGRWGLQHVGVPASGAMDRQALALGNVLVGNEEGAAALEVTLSGPTLRFAQDALVALVGTDMHLQVDERDCPAWTAVPVRSGGILSVGSATETGCRSWLCVAGGIDVPEVLGSRSTLLRVALGGFAGRALKAGDRLPLLPLREEARRLEGLSCPVTLRLSPATDEPVPVLPGPQLQSLALPARQAFLKTTWTTSSKSDRMGLRLEGPALRLSGGPDVISEVVPEGAIEVSGSGMPIIMLADHQTTGGYVKPFVVASAALGRLAQRLPGDPIRFRLSTPDEARQMLADQFLAREQMTRQRAAWRRQRSGGILQVSVNGKGQRVEWQEVTPLEVDDEHHG
ncbi:5-oxoprolinase subunit PxpB [bacterium]|nr:5-oxoprolinase subunit PxpB [bacterium]